MAGPILAIPPFPGSNVDVFAVPRKAAGKADVSRLLAALASGKVGGCYWGEQPPLPATPYCLDGTPNPVSGSVAWANDADPWHLLTGASNVRLPHGDSRLLLAMAAQKSVIAVSEHGSETEVSDAEVEAITQAALTDWQWRDPFSQADIPVEQAIALARFWRKLIDANRPIAAALGFAYWKRPTVAPLLWNGRDDLFRRSLPTLLSGQAVAVWQARLSAKQNTSLAKSKPRVMEVEDGFIRSAGLGADCVPPLSIIVDAMGVHFDPSRPSALEDLLQNGSFPADLLDRAAALRQAIIASGLSKYERGQAVPLPRPAGNRLHVLVPGQVEDDRAVTSGGALSSNLELLRRTRDEVGQDAFIIYKPHPDVLAGHRRGHVADADMAALADRVEANAPIASLIDMVDALHVNSSLAGFEALLRDKQVTVHGVPFYAGWGLTVDRGPVPARRTARRSVDELVAAALLLYPRYLDPITGLPCPPEVLVDRLASPKAQRLSTTGLAVVAGRRLQGKLRARISNVLETNRR